MANAQHLTRVTTEILKGLVVANLVMAEAIEEKNEIVQEIAFERLSALELEYFALTGRDWTKDYRDVM